MHFWAWSEYFVSRIKILIICLLQFSRSVVSVMSVVSDSFRPHELQHARPPCPSPTLEPTQVHVHWVLMPSNHLILCRPLLLLPFSNPSQHQSLCQWVNSSHEVAKLLEFQLQHHSLQRNPRADLQNEQVGSPCSPRDSQESSSTPQFKIINFLALSFLHSSTLTSIHDYWKNHSLD